MNILKIIEAILGTAEQIVPIFIHNPKSQQVEGVIVSTVNGVLGALTTPATKAAVTGNTVIAHAVTGTPIPPAK